MVPEMFCSRENYLMHCINIMYMLKFLRGGRGKLSWGWEIPGHTYMSLCIKPCISLVLANVLTYQHGHAQLHAHTPTHFASMSIPACYYMYMHS